VLLLALGLAFVGVASAAAQPVQDSTLAFRLTDQFGQVHDAARFRGRPLILVGAGRGGRSVGTGWVVALRGMQDDSAGAAFVPVVAVADLRGLPRLLRRLVRAQFPDDRRQPVLLDWNGSVARQLAFDPTRCTIVVIGPDGQAHARVTPDSVDAAGARALLRQARVLTTARSTAAARTPGS
jgi:hypothetical protein